jgi:hypothetical protein
MNEKSIATLIQEEIVALLNADAQLMQGSCKAIAENRGDVFSEVSRVTRELNGVAVVVTTPAFAPDGEGSGEATLVVRAVETPAIRNRRGSDAMTALDAALRVRKILASDTCTWTDGPVQEFDERRGVLAASVTFAVSAAM